MFRKFMLAVPLMLAMIVPSYAKNLAVPAKNPAATIVIPDSWDLDETEFGYSATSPDEDVIFSVEIAPEELARLEAQVRALDCT